MAPTDPPETPPEGDAPRELLVDEQRPATPGVPRRTKGEASLVVHQPPGPLRLARSLEEATPRSLLHVDDRGQVRSPARYHLLNALGFGGAGLVALVGVLLYASLFGAAWGVLAAVVFGGVLGVGARRRRSIVQSATLIADGQLDEAEALCRGILDGRFAGRSLRAAAHHNLAAVATRRGRFDDALKEVRAALRLRHRGLRRNLYMDLLAYSEIELLVNLGRVGEARGRLEAGRVEPEGDYLLMLHWSAELAVQFAEGRCTLDEEQLWERSRRALQIGAAPDLLALCAWAQAQLGDEAMAEHLLAEAVDRALPETPVSFPALWVWVASRRPPSEPPGSSE